VVLVVVLVLLAILGAFVVTYYLIKAMQVVVQRHLSVLDRQQKNREHVVVDLEGKTAAQIAALPTVHTLYPTFTTYLASDDELGSINSGGSGGGGCYSDEIDAIKQEQQVVSVEPTAPPPPQQPPQRMSSAMVASTYCVSQDDARGMINQGIVGGDTASAVEGPFSPIVPSYLEATRGSSSTA
jgi:hypothetical protein